MRKKAVNETAVRTTWPANVLLKTSFVAIKKLRVWNRQKVSELRPRKKSRIFADIFKKRTDIQC